MENKYDAYNPNKILSFYNELSQIRDGLIPNPRMAIVYPSYVCNQNCVYCMYKDWIDDSTMMSESQLKSTLSQLINLGVEGCEACGGGEAFSNPHIKSAIEYADTVKPIKYAALTNGTLIDDNMAEFIAKRFSYIRFSMDDVCVEGYNKKRRPSNAGYERVIRNIKNILSSRDKCLVGIKILLINSDLDKIKQSIEFADNIGVDSIQFKVAEYENQNPLDNKVFQNADKIRKVIDEHKGNVKILASLNKTSIDFICKTSPLQVTVDARGDVYICCYYQHRPDEHKIGNMFEKKLSDIWGSETHKQKLQSISVDKCNVWNCRFHGYNKFYRDIFLTDKMQMEFC